MSVAGYVWPFEKWKLFQRQWRRMLRDNDLKFFHMTDFETFNGVYKGWTRRRHDSVIKRVIRIITASRPSWMPPRQKVREVFERRQPSRGVPAPPRRVNPEHKRHKAHPRSQHRPPRLPENGV